MADLGVLAQIPGLAGYLQTQQMNNAQSAQNLQNAAGQMGLLAQIQARQQDEALKSQLAQTGGDVTKAMQYAIQSGNLAGAAKLAPLLKLQQDKQFADQMASVGGGANLTADRLDEMALRAAAHSPTAAANLTRLAESKRAKEANAATLGIMRQQVSPITEVPQMGIGATGALAERANLNIPEPAQGAIPPEVQAAIASGNPFSYGIGQSSNPIENVQLTGGALAPLMQSKNQVIAQRAKNLQEMINQPGFQGDVNKINNEIDNLVKLDAAANRSGTVPRPIAVIGPDGKPVYINPEQAIGMTPASTGGSATPISGDFSLKGQEFLDSLPVSDRELIRKLANYEIDPKTLSVRGGQRERVLSMVSQFDPTYDDTQYANKRRAIAQFGSGPQGNTVRSLNVAIEHIDTLGRAADALKNGEFTPANKAYNEFVKVFGKTPPNTFEAIRDFVSNEVVKGTIGNAGALQDRAEAASRVRASSSPEQLKELMNGWTELMGGQVKGLEQQYTGSTGLKDFRTRYLTPRAIDAINLSETKAGSPNGNKQKYVETRRTKDGRMLGKKADGTIEEIK